MVSSFEGRYLHPAERLSATKPTCGCFFLLLFIFWWRRRRRRHVITHLYVEVLFNLSRDHRGCLTGGAVGAGWALCQRAHLRRYPARTGIPTAWDVPVLQETV